MDVVPVDDDLDDAVPHLLADVVACDADQVEDGVHIPGVVHGVFLGEDGHFEHLMESPEGKGKGVECEKRHTRRAEQ